MFSYFVWYQIQKLDLLYYSNCCLGQYHGSMSSWSISTTCCYSYKCALPGYPLCNSNLSDDTPVYFSKENSRECSCFYNYYILYSANINPGFFPNAFTLGLLHGSTHYFSLFERLCQKAWITCLLLGFQISLHSIACPIFFAHDCTSHWLLYLSLIWHGGCYA